LKYDKLTKALRDNQTHTDSSINSLGESLRNDLELAKKRLQSEIKQESIAITHKYLT